MGNAKSVCRVANEARYEILVEVFSPKDVGGQFAKQRLTVLPGNHCDIPTPKKGIQLRISGNGRSQDLQRGVPGEVILVRKVQRSLADTPEPKPTEPETSAQPLSREGRSQRQESEQYSTDKKRVREWLDDKDKYSKDELQQLVVKLNKEGRAEHRAKLIQQIRKKEAESREPTRDDTDELSSSIAALQQRNDRMGLSHSHKGDAAPQKNNDEENEEQESQFSFNTDSKTDDLMAAINRLTTGSSTAHRKQNSWERAPQLFAQI